MDRLDKWTTFFLIVITLYTAALLLTAEGPTRAEEAEQQKRAAAQYVFNPEMESRIQQARNLLVQNNLEKTELLVDSLLSEFPYEGKLYMLKGDILVRRQQPIAAMYEYREAIDLNPDFLDKKTDLFQGKKIKVTVEEALALIEANLKENGGDNGLKEDLNTAYYMKRKLAGSCG